MIMMMVAVMMATSIRIIMRRNKKQYRTHNDQ